MSAPPLQFAVDYIRYDCQLTFEPGKNFTTKLAKPEELKQSIVSQPFGFYEEKFPEGWEGFGAHLKALVGQPYVWKRTGMVFIPGVGLAFDDEDKGGVLRLLITSIGPLDDYSDSKEEQKSRQVTLPMKVKLIPDEPSNPEDKAGYVKEQHFLAKLGRVCGHQNLVLEMGTIWDDDGHSLWCPGVQLLWNEKTQVWEGEAQLSFQAAILGRFNGNYSREDFKARMWKLKVLLKEDGINRVLQQAYFKGFDYVTLREMLDEGRFWDVEINGTDAGGKKTSIKAHRIVLSAASTVFADMLNNVWEEGKMGIVTLPESEDTLQAMLHFIYYGGTERILAARQEVALELLQAAHKYMIENLVEVAGMMLKIKMGLEKWLSVDAAVELFCFVRNVEGKLWKGLKEKAIKFLEGKKFDELKTSEGYLKLYQIAVQLGPAFVSAFTKSGGEGANIAMSLPKVPEGMLKEEVALMYDFLSASSVDEDGICRSLEVTVGLLVLAEYCGRAIPKFSGHVDKENYTVDWLVELFCTARAKDDKSWEHFKMGAGFKLKGLLKRQPKQTKACSKYQEMVNTNHEAAAELAQLAGLGIEEPLKLKVRKTKPRKRT